MPFATDAIEDLPFAFDVTVVATVPFSIVSSIKTLALFVNLVEEEYVRIRVGGSPSATPSSVATT